MAWSQLLGQRLDERSVGLIGLLVIWPLVETVVRQQWGYTLGVALLGLVGGLLWFIVGRRDPARHSRVSTQPR